MKKKALSVIVPAYNMENYLDKCLSSLIIPSIDLLDIIVVNDGSKDATSEIAHRYSNRYPESIKIIDKENGNYGSCVNIGIKTAIGKYTKILDADDTFNTQELEKFINTISELDCDLIISDYDIVDENNRITYHYFPKSLASNIYTFQEIEKSICNGLFQMHAVTYKTENIQKIGYRQLIGISYTDQQWMFLPMSAVNSVYYFKGVVYRYLVGREGQTVSSDAYARNSRAVKLITEQMMRDYFSIQSDSSYFSYRLKKQLALLYYIYLIKKDDPKSIVELKEFDSSLKNSLPSHYEYLNDERLFSSPFKYIKYWRSNGQSDRYRILSIIKGLIKLYKLF